MKDMIEVDQERKAYSTMVQLVNRNCCSFTSDQDTTCVEGSNSFMENISGYHDVESNMSSFRTDAAVINKVILKYHLYLLHDK